MSKQNDVFEAARELDDAAREFSAIAVRMAAGVLYGRADAYAAFTRLKTATDNLGKLLGVAAP